MLAQTVLVYLDFVGLRKYEAPIGVLELNLTRLQLMKDFEGSDISESGEARDIVD